MYRISISTDTKLLKYKYNRQPMMKRNNNGIISLLKVCQLLLNNCHHDILRSNPVKNWLAATNFFDHKPNFTTAKNFKETGSRQLTLLTWVF